MGQLPNASNYIYVTLLFTVIALHLRQALDMIMINRAFSTFREYSGLCQISKMEPFKKIVNG